MLRRGSLIALVALLASGVAVGIAYACSPQASFEWNKPRSGFVAPGETVTFTGSNFQSGGRYEVRLEGRLVDSGEVPPTGYPTASFVVPESTRPGSYSISGKAFERDEPLNEEDGRVYPTNGTGSFTVASPQPAATQPAAPAPASSPSAQAPADGPASGDQPVTAATPASGPLPAPASRTPASARPAPGRESGERSPTRRTSRPGQGVTTVTALPAPARAEAPKRVVDDQGSSRRQTISFIPSTSEPGTAPAPRITPRAFPALADPQAVAPLPLARVPAPEPAELPWSALVLAGLGLMLIGGGSTGLVMARRRTSDPALFVAAVSEERETPEAETEAPVAPFVPATLSTSAAAQAMEAELQKLIADEQARPKALAERQLS